MRFRHLFDDETSKRMILLEYSPLQPWMLNPRGLSLSNPYVPNIIWSWYLINSSRKFTWIPFFDSLRVESQQNLSDIFSTCDHYFTFKYCPFTRYPKLNPLPQSPSFTAVFISRSAFPWSAIECLAKLQCSLVENSIISQYVKHQSKIFLNQLLYFSLICI